MALVPILRISSRNPTSIFKATDGFFIIGDDLNIPMLLDLETGKATHINPSTGASYPHVFGLSSGYTYWYVVEEDANNLIGITLSNYRVCRINKTTLIGRQVNSLTGVTDLVGLGNNGTNLYTINKDTNKLSIVSTSTRSLTDVGSSTDFGVSEGDVTAFTVASSTQGYIFGGDTKKAYIVNLSTGVATPAVAGNKAGYGNTSSYIGAAFYHQAGRDVLTVSADYDRNLKEFFPIVGQLVPTCTFKSNYA